MEPDRQFEIQLGHMCNNRCVFCVSGQRTAMREAFPLEAAPVLEKLQEGRAQGLRKVTLLGGEPTIQPGFLEVLRGAVAMGFEEIVIFTNGVKTSRASYVDEVLETGGRFVWRLSFQGATALAHERTTKKLGSFMRLRETLGNLRARGQRITVNMCVVRSNYASVAEFPALLLPHGVEQLHLDMVRPLDAGVRSEDEMRDMLPRYADMVGPLEEMVARFERERPGFDVNIGNLPYCVAPSLAPWIHHDGETTFTVAVDDRDQLSAAWDKYEVKRRDKLKLGSCASCVFDGQCSGVFETYARHHGTDDLVPVTPERLTVLDPSQRLFVLHVRPLLARLAGWALPAPFTSLAVHEETRAGEVVLRAGSAGDAFAVIVPVGILLGRVGCFMNGCCLGKPVSGFFAARDVSGVSRWPAPFVEGAFQVGILAVILLLQRRGLLRDRLFFLYLTAYGLFRFLHEFMRATPKIWLGLSGYQCISLIMAGIGFWMLRRRSKFMLAPTAAGGSLAP